MNARSRFLTTICCVTAASFASAGDPEKPGAAKVVVRACLPVERQVAPYEDFVGRIEAAASVELKPRVTGYLERVLFKDGSEVKQGDVLFEIDARPYQAQLAKAQADLSANEARLRSAQNAFDRVSALAKTGTISREELDKTAGERDVAEANLQVARAALDSARITLGFTKVIAPIDGRIGRRHLDVGNLVKADETTLANIVNTNSLSVVFEIDERTLLRLAQAAKDGKPKEFAVAIGVADETGFPRRAKMDFVDNRVVAARGTIAARAVLFDPDKQLRPGMSCRVRLTTGEPKQALLVPERALRRPNGFPSLLIVNDKNRVEVRPVELGQRQPGDMLEIVKGLKTGERVVVDSSDPFLSANDGIDAVEMVDPTQPSATKKRDGK